MDMLSSTKQLGKFFLSMKYSISRSTSTIITGLEISKQTYEARGFEIDNIFGDTELNI